MVLFLLLLFLPMEVVRIFIVFISHCVCALFICVEHTPRSTPSCISIQDPSRRVEVLRGTHYSEYPLKRKKMCLSGSVRLSWVGQVRPEMLCLRTRLPLFPKASRGLLYDGRPPVGGLLHKAPAEEKLYPSK